MTAGGSAARHALQWAGVALVLAGLVIAGIGCALPTPAKATPPPLPVGRHHSTVGSGPKVLAIGDSNLAWAAPDLEQQLAGRYTLTVDAQPGITSIDPRWAEWLPEDVPDVTAVVVQLGTNDTTTLDKDSAIDGIMRQLPAVPVLWNRVCELFIGDADWNAALDRAQERWPNLRVMPFDARFAGTDLMFPAPNRHLNQDGWKVYAEWTEKNLDATN